MKKLPVVILSNNFHNTSVSLNANQALRYEILLTTNLHDWSLADKLFQKRIWNKLCGIENCTCGNAFGVR